METSEYDTSDLVMIDVNDIELGSLTITSSQIASSNVYISSPSTYGDTQIHSNEVYVITEDGKEVKLVEELSRVSTELAVMRELMSTLLENIKLDPNIELDFDKRVEQHRMLGRLSGE